MINSITDLEYFLKSNNNLHSAYKLLEDALELETQDQYLKTIDKATERMRKLVSALVEFSKLNQDKISELIDTRVIIDEVISDLSRLIEITGSQIIITGNSFPEIEIYAVEFGLLIQNLGNFSIGFSVYNTCVLGLMALCCGTCYFGFCYYFGFKEAKTFFSMLTKKIKMPK